MLVQSRSDIIEIPITNDMRRYANDNAHVGAMNEYSMLGSEGEERTIDGLLGELAVKSYFPMLTAHSNRSNFQKRTI